MQRCVARHLVGRPGDKMSVSFLAGMGADMGGIELAHGLDMLCQEVHEALAAGLPLLNRPFVTSREAFLSPWTGCDKRGVGCGENEGEGT